MNYDATLDQFRRNPQQLLLTSDVRLADALQPRVARIVPVRDKGRIEQGREQHIATLRLALEASEQTQLDRVWLARIEQPAPVETGLYLVDGHHRLTAYKQAGRDSIPASILPMEWHTAITVSKLVNCIGRSLALHKQQCLDAAWQYLAILTHRGANKIPKGESLRSISGRFGISRNTVASMLTYLPCVVPEEFNSLAIDPGTGWPRWRHVREAKSPWHTSLPSSEQQRLERDAERVARNIVKLVDGSSPAVRARALEMLANDEVDASDQLASVELLAHFSPAPRLPCPN